MGYTINTYSNQTSYNLTYNNRGVSGIKYIVVHYTGTSASAKNNIIYFSGGNRSASADFFIDSGSIWQFNPNPLRYYSWHCGDGKGAYGITNSNSVGIEVVSSGEDFTSAEIDRLTWLVQKLMSEYGVDSNHVVRHYDASRKQCPYPYINSTKWAKLKAQITGGQYSGNESSSRDYLQQGDSGAAVKELQQLLISKGYSCGSAGADGDFGPSTLSAVKAFQKDNGLVVDGIAGQLTMGKLKAGSQVSQNPNDLQYGSQGNAVKTLQENLNKLGYDCGEPDGDFGPKTKSAVIAFQKNKGLVQDGIVGDITKSAINSALNSYKPASTSNIVVICKNVQIALSVADDGDFGPVSKSAWRSKVGYISKSHNSRLFPYVGYCQKALNAKGYNCGTVDGIAGSMFDVACRNFQRASGLAADGMLGQDTAAKLFN